MAKKRNDHMRARARDTRRTVPNPVPTAATANTFGTIAEFVAADQAALQGIGVTQSSLLGLPAANYAVNKIANAIASMSPLVVVEGDGITRRQSTPPIAARPLATLGTFAFWHLAVSHALTTGNFLGLLADFDANGFARQVMPVPSNIVSAYFDQAGYAVYEVAGIPYGTQDVVHIPGPHIAPGELWARSPVQVYRQALGMHVAEQTYGANSFATGAVPSAIISLDRDEVPERVAQQVQTDWLARHGAAQRRPAVTPRTMTITPLSWSPHDAEFIESRKMSVAECALMFDLDPSDLGASIGGQSMTYANISDRQVARIVEVYGPWARRFEEGWSDLIPGPATCQFQPEKLLRMSPKELADLQSVRLSSGVRTVDEERMAEGLPPMPEEEPNDTGDTETPTEDDTDPNEDVEEGMPLEVEA